MSSHGKCGGCGCPQADGVGERESSEFKRNLNGGPQADCLGERESSGINRELKEMGPQADGVRKQVSITDDRLFTHYKFSAVFIKLRKFLMTDC